MSAPAQPGSIQPGGGQPGGAAALFGPPTSWESLRGPGPTVLPPFLSGGALLGAASRSVKHPEAAKIFRIPWGADLEPGRVAAVTASAAGGTATAAAETPGADAANDWVLVKVSGGADGELATVRVDATLDDGQVLSYAFDVSVEAAARETATKPAAVSRVYRVFWGKELDGAVLSGFGVTVAAGLTLEQALYDDRVGVVFVRLSGGTAGATYAVKLTAATADGQSLVYVLGVAVQ